MIKKIDIAGIQLDNYTFRETIMQIERMINDSVFHTLEEVNMDILMQAQSDERVKTVLENLNLTILTEYEILDAAGEKSAQRKHEIESKNVFYETLKRVERNHMSVFLLGQKEEDIILMKEYICQEFPKIRLGGMEAMENCVGEMEATVNEINAATVDVVISVLPSPQQELFLLQQKGKISARLWYGVDESKLVKKKSGLWESLCRKIRLHRLELHISKYEEQEVDK